MSFSRMKPLPKMIAIVAIVAVVGYGIKLGLDTMPKKAPAVAADPVVTTTVPAESAQPAPAPAQVAPPPVAAAPAPPPAPVSEPSGLKPAGGQDSGMDAVLKAGKK